MLRSSISRRLGRLAAGRYWHALDRGKPWSVPAGVWSRVPQHVRNWISYRVIEPANDRSIVHLSDDHPLAKHCRGRFTEYSFPASSILMLWDLLHRRAATRILELGSGVSTVMFAAYAREQALLGKSVRVTSIEHDGSWADATRQMLAADGLDAFAAVVHAPIATQTLGGTPARTYDVASSVLALAAGDEGFDMCLIDGPPAHAFGRIGSLLLAKDYLSEGATVLLDDALRPHEQECWSQWLRVTGGALSRGQLLLLPHGIMMGSWGHTSATSGKQG